MSNEEASIPTVGNTDQDVTAMQSIAGFPCPECGAVAPRLTDKDFDNYFKEINWTCAHCEHSDTIWRVLGSAVKKDNPFLSAAVVLGAAQMSFGQILLKRDQKQEINLSLFGVPEEARIISVNFTPYASPEGRLAPMWIIQEFRRQPVYHGYLITPVVLEGDPVENIVAVGVSWFPPSAGEDAEALLNAIEMFSEGYYRQAVVPASVAVEDKLASILTSHYSQFAGKEKVASFLTDGATFGHQLSPLLPSLLSFTSAPAMPRALVDGLNALRKLRNKVAHEHASVTKEAASQSLMTALFGYQYLDLYGSLLVPKGPQATD